MKKKKRKHSVLALIGKILLTLILFAVAGLCIATMWYFGQHLYEKTVARTEEIKLEREAEAQAEKERAEAEAAAALEAQLAAEKAEAEARAIAEAEALAASTPDKIGDVDITKGYGAYTDAATVAIGDGVVSTHALLIDLSNDHILVDKAIHEKMYPASMTKVLSALVASEQVDNPEDTFTVTPEIVNYSLSNGCNAAGFVAGETVTVKDLFYGTILPSGGEAALSLATYVAGSQEAFVDLMNQKAAELGVSENVSFTNCIGLYDDNHYCTPVDMAILMKAALKNDFCREVLSEHVYYTSKTEQNPEGLVLSNWFLRRIEDRDCGGGTVVAGKTGFVNQSGCCAVSYYVSPTGVPYICVTAGADSEWSCIADHANIYKTYAP